VPLADLEQHRLHALLLDRLAVLLGHLEALAVELCGLVEVRDGDTYVVDPAKQHGRGVYEAG
jgi:hypothetical protein